MAPLWEAYPVIRQCGVFSGLGPGELDQALVLLRPSLRQYARGQLIFDVGDRLTRSGILLEGESAAGFLDDHANEVVISRFSPGMQFGSALVCSGTCHTPVQMRALTDCTVLYVDLQPLLRGAADGGGLVCRLLANLARDFAGENVRLNEKARILSQKRLRARIRISLASRPREADGSILLPFSKAAWAAAMGVDRTALQRELRRMGEEGILAAEGRRIRVLRPEFLA